MLRVLKQFYNNKPHNRRKHVSTLNDAEIKFLFECALNIINETVPFNIQKLLRFEKERT